MFHLPKYLLVFILSASQICSYEAANLKISVYYESLCPDSKAFITTQLFPTYKSLGYLFDIDFIPFGKATFEQLPNGSWNFTCQHGPNECYGNKYHSCAISLFPADEVTAFVDCSMNADTPTNQQEFDLILEACSQQSGISWTDLQRCYQIGQADQLLIQNGVRTNNVPQALSWIPTIVFNDQYNQTLQDDASTNLFKVICDFQQVKPVACLTY